MELILATVTQVSPLRVRLDGATASSSATRISEFTPAVNQRVVVSQQASTIFAHGVLGGANADAHTHSAYLPVAGKAADSNLLDGYDLAQLDYRNRSQMLAHNNVSAKANKWDGVYLSWTDRLIMLGAGRGGSGGLDNNGGWTGINQPVNGTVISGSGGEANLTVTASGIPIPIHSALYFDPTTGLFQIVGYTANFTVPSHWIMVAHRSEADGRCWFAPEGIMDYFHPFAYTNGHSAYNYGGEACYIKNASGIVSLQGLITKAANASVVFTLPSGYRPGVNLIWSAMTSFGPFECRLETSGAFFYNSTSAAAWASVALTYQAGN